MTEETTISIRELSKKDRYFNSKQNIEK